MRVNGKWIRAAAIAALAATIAAADALPWGFLVPEDDARDAEMRRWDEADSRAFVDAANESEVFAGRRFVWTRMKAAGVLEAAVPFAELRFDAARPAELGGEEKEALREWLVRGGFLLLFEDAYPYTQEKLRSQATLPVYEFFTRELPALDAEFSVVRIDDAHPLFHAYYQTSSVASIAREMRENPNYRGRTLVLHRGRPVAFFMGRYSYEKNGRWMPASRPLKHNFSSDLKSYQLIVNTYVYAMTNGGAAGEAAAASGVRPDRP